MKSNSDIRPATVEQLGNGSFYYNFNVKERTQEANVAPQAEAAEDVAEVERVTYDYDTVQLWGNPDYAAIVKAVIREEIDETKEFGYVNDYNAAALGLIEDEAEAARAVASYKEYLTFVRDVKAQVKADLTAAGYFKQ